MRLFIGIKFPEDVLGELARVQNEMRSQAKRGRFVAKSNLHLTLLFLGEVSEQQLRPISEVLEKVANKHTVFSLELNNIGSFGSIPTFRVIWAGIDGDIPRMANLQKEIAVSLTELGFILEKRSYQPHITLGRDVDLPQLESVKEHSKNLAVMPFQVNQFFLIESKFENSRLVYKPLFSFPLGG